MSKTKKDEFVVNARPVSRGVATGRAVSLHGRKLHFYRVRISAKHLPKELKRFTRALDLAISSIQKVIKSRSGSGVLIAQQMLLEDPQLRSQIEDVIRSQKVNAEWAVKLITDGYIKKLKCSDDEHIRAKYLDLEDVADRLITALGSGKKQLLKVPSGSIVLAKELNPSAMIELAESKIKGVVTERGGWTSHTFILARELNIPAVTGVRHVLQKFDNGSRIVVDGNRGIVIANPNKSSVSPNGKPKRIPALLSAGKKAADELCTLDGRRINIRANADSVELYKKAMKFGAKGIGLFRSEFLFNAHSGYPDEEAQFEFYQRLASGTGGDGVNIRTFDINAAQLPGFEYEKENNPALGLRAIRLSLAQKRYFRIQLRAILRAATQGAVSVCLPMVSDVSEIIAAKKLLLEETKKLTKTGVAAELPPLGVMIEVPAAVMSIEDICAEVDFLCLGTNDLVQYLLAADRDNALVADLFKTLHPAVTVAIKSVIDAAAQARKPLTICGEMAGSPFYLPLLVGLGADTFSMNVNSIPRIIQTVKGIAFEEAVDIGNRVRKCRSAHLAENLLKKYIKSHWGHAIDLAALPGDRPSS